MEQFRRLGLYQEFFRPLGISSQLAFSLDSTPPRVIGIALNRSSGEFTYAERQMLSLLRPHATQAYENARRLSKLMGIASEVNAAQDGTPIGDALSAREREVLLLVAEGITDKEAAKQLGLSVRTIHTYLQHAYRKLGVTSRTAAARMVIGQRV
jgi:DNA-binding NarL/FixJ family response regulator